MEQWFSSPKQHKWVTQMFGYYYEIIDRKGKDNIVADSLSHHYEGKICMLSLSTPILDWLTRMHPRSFHYSTHEEASYGP